MHKKIFVAVDFAKSNPNRYFWVNFAFNILFSLAFRTEIWNVRFSKRSQRGCNVWTPRLIRFQGCKWIFDVSFVWISWDEKADSGCVFKRRNNSSNYSLIRISKWDVKKSKKIQSTKQHLLISIIFFRLTASWPLAKTLPITEVSKRHLGYVKSFRRIPCIASGFTQDVSERCFARQTVLRVMTPDWFYYTPLFLGRTAHLAKEIKNSWQSLTQTDKQVFKGIRNREKDQSLSPEPLYSYGTQRLGCRHAKSVLKMNRNCAFVFFNRPIRTGWRRMEMNPGDYLA